MQQNRSHRRPPRSAQTSGCPATPVSRVSIAQRDRPRQTSGGRLRLARWLALYWLAAHLLPLLAAPAAATPLAQANDEAAPAQLAQVIQSALFRAQTALLAGDQATAEREIVAASEAVAAFLPRFAADPGVADALRELQQDAVTAVANGDSAALNLAQGRLWATLVRGAMAETVAATAANDATTAATWLLVRDFRPTTRYARPNADATLAVRDLQARAISPDEAVTIVEADLLDTYQSRLESALNSVAEVAPAGVTPGQAHDIGLAIGYWQILAAAYETQFGTEARANADDTLAALSGLVTGAATDPATAVASATAIVQSFRAAPLSEADLARRGGQLLRYLALVSTEYGRGVKGQEVLHDFEITEARAFLTGARAAFADLRLPLQGINPDETIAIDQILTTLGHQLDAATARTSVTDPAVLKGETEDAIARLTSMYPSGWTASSQDADFDVVSSLLDQMIAAVAAGEYQLADASRLEAYAIFETGPEKRLLAFAPTTVQRVEQLFWDSPGDPPGLHRLLTNRASVSAVQATTTQLEADLLAAKEALSGGTAPAAIIFNAATIVFREGLEAVLILASLLASMIGANRRFKLPLGLGAAGALAATVLLFFLAQSALLSFSQYGEQIEAIVSVIAIAVLLLVMNWFFHKVYWTRWIAGHHQRRRLILGGVAGQTLGLVVLGFTSVFREGAETVLFLQALVLDAGTWIVVQGTLLGLAATAIVGVLTLVLQTKLPHKKMLIVTGMMIAFVLVTMVGGTVHTLQLVGWLPIHPVTGLEQMPYWLGVWFGLFPSWEGLLAQALALVFVVGSYFLAERVQRQKPNAALAPAGSGAAG